MVEKVNPENDGQWVGYDSLTSGVHPTTNTTLYTSFEGYENNLDDRYGEIFTGWFTAPVTANYRFYIAADDSAKLYIDSTNPYDAENPVGATLEMIAETGYRKWRDYFSTNTGQISEWISMEKGKSYLMQGLHVEGGGGEHFTASVEID
jgi:hypothetical protein